MTYRYLAHSIGGFIQQTAVCYLQRGYFFYVSGKIPAEKDPLVIDQKLLTKYQIALSKDQRYRRKQYGQATLQYLRYQNTFLLIATQGEHLFFSAEQNAIRDARHFPIHLFGYTLSCKNGHAVVGLSRKTYRDLEAYFLDRALHRKAEALMWELRTLPFEPYAPVYRQIASLWKAINRKRKTAGLPLLPASLRRKRRIYRPFEVSDTQSTA